ncbi:MAG: hypothetical protein KGZ88_14125 [Methylomicrobium sp.]|nr:hypothetical protein [Methylomicrobium sp.]
MQQLAEKLHNQLQQRRIEDLQKHLTRYSGLIDDQHKALHKQRWRVRIAYGLAALALISLMVMSRYYTELPVLRVAGLECQP